jgi:peptidoglycan-N-acetylglucosamine deacetylase
MPTTVQAYPHRRLTYLKNAVRRASLPNFIFALNHGGSRWTDLAVVAARRAIASGGILHIWGHSWEIDQMQQWNSLEDVLRILARLKLRTLTNGQICNLGSGAPSPA